MFINIHFGDSVKNIFATEAAFTVEEIWHIVETKTGLTRTNFYMTCNNRLVSDKNLPCDGNVIINPKLLGGKGGFGSMLRAIGAQIEKTTNREACRDLSGRRLRDINEEKRLKAWIEKQSKREEEAAERKKKKLVKLCSVPKHEFKDQQYDLERSTLTEKISDAVEEGFKTLDTSSGIKRKSENEPVLKKKRKTFLDVDSDIDLDGVSDSEDSSDENSSFKKNQILNPNNFSSESNTSTEDKQKDFDDLQKQEIPRTQDVDEDSGRSTDCSVDDSSKEHNDYKLKESIKN